MIVIVGEGTKLISLVFVSVGGVSELGQGGTNGDDVLEGFVEGESVAMSALGIFLTFYSPKHCNKIVFLCIIEKQFFG